ncbi:MAG: DUF1501 domain-containing protein [Planctomycetota bacterium]|jgi:hypothetical protein
MFTRRELLRNSACGFGALATYGLFCPATHAIAEEANASFGRRIVGLEGLHHRAKAKRVIFLFMQGGISQVDSFDPKPILDKRDGEMIAFDDAREFANTRKLGGTHRVMKSPWAFKQYGQCGHWVSDLFPNIAQHVDRLQFIHSMHTEGVAHGPSTLFLHSGSLNTVRPSMGSWTLYGLGSENENLPGFISIAPSIGNGGFRNYGSAFLPARFQGTPLGKATQGDLRIENIEELNSSDKSQNARWRIQRQLQQIQLQRLINHPAGHEMMFPGADELESLIGSYELAARMQSSSPEIFDLSTETQETRNLYGIDQKETETYGKRCLLARRLCEAGVRFIQVNYGDDSANPAWDQHSNLPKHLDHATAVDKPVAGLLTDLHRRGLLEDTIVWFGSEFGRQPYAEKNGTGRDHNPGGFTVWLAGGGLKPGHSYGHTDEFGQLAIQNKVHMHDLHATILHLLGIDHERLVYRYGGRDFRLTDVYGKVVHDIIS